MDDMEMAAHIEATDALAQEFEAQDRGPCQALMGGSICNRPEEHPYHDPTNENTLETWVTRHPYDPTPSDLVIVDDPYENFAGAMNPDVRRRVLEWWTGTILNQETVEPHESEDPKELAAAVAAGMLVDVDYTETGQGQVPTSCASVSDFARGFDLGACYRIHGTVPGYGAP